MGYWKSKVLPKIKKVFEKNATKKAAAAEASKPFDDSKEGINKEFEEKKAELQPKVLEIYEASSAEIKALVKEPKEAGLKKQSDAVQKFIEELVKIEFPGSKLLSDVSSKFGPSLVPGPIIFIFEKVSTFIVTEEKTEDKTEEPKQEGTTTSKDKDIVVEKEEVVVVAEEAPVAPVDEPPVKVEEAAVEPPKA